MTAQWAQNSLRSKPKDNEISEMLEKDCRVLFKRIDDHVKKFKQVDEGNKEISSESRQQS